MDSTTKFFRLMRRQSIENELKYQQTLKELVQKNKDLNEEVWDEDEDEVKAYETEWVLQQIDEEIQSLKEKLKNEPNLNE